LEPSIALYERGEALRAHCEQLLQRIEAKVEKITLDAQGNPNGSAPFEA
jgi:exodeoxyribonuclease VII small subunit